MDLDATVAHDVQANRIKLVLSGDELRDVAAKDDRLVRSLQHILDRITNRVSEHRVTIRIYVEGLAPPWEPRSRHQPTARPGEPRDRPAPPAPAQQQRQPQHNRRGGQPARGQHSDRQFAWRGNAANGRQDGRRDMQRRDNQRQQSRQRNDRQRPAPATDQSPEALARAAVDRARSSGSAASTPPLSPEQIKIAQSIIAAEPGVSQVIRNANGDLRRIVVTPTTSGLGGQQRKDAQQLQSSGERRQGGRKPRRPRGGDSRGGDSRGGERRGDSHQSAAAEQGSTERRKPRPPRHRKQRRPAAEQTLPPPLPNEEEFVPLEEDSQEFNVQLVADSQDSYSDSAARWPDEPASWPASEPLDDSGSLDDSPSLDDSDSYDDHEPFDDSDWSDSALPEYAEQPEDDEPGEQRDDRDPEK